MTQANHTSRLVHATAHAIERYQRRVANVSAREAYVALSTETIRNAASAGACSVILPSGHKVILRGFSVVTVKPKHCRKRRIHNRPANHHERSLS
jgi:DNA-binding transcriptional LysR family regulator